MKITKKLFFAKMFPRPWTKRRNLFTYMWVTVSPLSRGLRHLFRKQAVFETLSFREARFVSRSFWKTLLAELNGETCICFRKVSSFVKVPRKQDASNHTRSTKLPASLTRNSKIVSCDPSAMGGKSSSKFPLVNSSILARSSSSNNAPTLHIKLKM